MSDFTITVVNPLTGQAETLPLDPDTAVQEVIGFCQALLGVVGDDVRLFKNGRALTNTATLRSAGVVNGDMLAAQKPVAAAPRSAPAATTSSRGGGLDFSNLLGAQSAAAAPAAARPTNSQPVYFPGMSLDDAMMHNPHPQAFISLLKSKDHLFKELRYHNPPLASKIEKEPLTKAIEIWREELVKGSISSALRNTTEYHRREDMTKRLARNSDDKEAKEYFAKIQRKKNAEEQYVQMMNEYPEAMGRVLMLYIDAKINGTPVQAFCDSGAQMTIMSKKLAESCGLLEYLDERFSGTAAGVGTGKILGKVHIAQLEIGGTFFPCSISIMDSPAPGAQEMPFLFGLDMMKRHLCQIDLQQGCLNFPVVGVKVPFLHEKDLSESQGGTQGFDADKANLAIQEALMKQFEGKDDKKDDMDESS
eukprot:scaffold34940_cov246-Amphora_coffeaeformis.AAC.6